MSSPRPTSNRHLREIAGRSTTFPPYAPLFFVSNDRAGDRAGTQLVSVVQAELRDNQVTGVVIAWDTQGQFDRLRPGLMEHSLIVLAEFPGDPDVFETAGRMRVSAQTTATWDAVATFTRVETSFTGEYLRDGQTLVRPLEVRDGHAYLLSFDDETVANTDAADLLNTIRFSSASISNPELFPVP